MDMVKVTYKDASYEFKKGTTLLEISKSFAKDYEYEILGGKVDSIVKSLNEIINEDAVIDFYDITSFVGNKMYERGAILILVKAVSDVLKEKVIIEHSIDKGIYCIINNLNEEKTKQIEKRMREIVDSNIPFEKVLMNRLKMRKYYEQIGWSDKSEILGYISNTYITIYKLDDIYDYMYGEMVISTSYVKEFNLQYVSDNGCVLMLPLAYDDNKVNKYTHHEDLYNAIMNHIKWSERIGVTNIADLNKLLAQSKGSDLVFMNEAIQNTQLIKVSQTIYDNKKIKLVLISGPSCSGKTTTSKKLQLFLKGFGLKPHVLAIDDYFKERSETPLDENGHKDYESIRAIDLELFNDHLNKLINGEEIITPTFNFITGKKEYKNKLKMENDGILIIEGLHSLNDELTSLINKEYKYKIYISPLTVLNIDNHNRLNTSDNRILRRMVRDNLRRGYNASETLSSWERVRAGETKYIFPYQDNADVVLNTSLLYEMSVLKVYAEPLLFSVSETDPNYSEALRLINILRVILPMPSASIPLDSIMREFIGDGCFDE